MTFGSPPRVRIAPSPSGYLHVGTARTAIFNYLFARRFGGKFLIRIEDTDAERSDRKLIEPILSALEWLGISPDEEIIHQSSRLDIYREFASRLLTSGHAYRCFCTKEELETERQEARKQKLPPGYKKRCLSLSDEEIQSRLAKGEKATIRLNIQPGETTFKDIVVGEIRWNNKDIEDFIVARSDGSATYNLAVVVDDHEMAITHVLRGNDHISNTFKQLHIYRALEWTLPEFGHLPLILRPDKRKVSKRLGDKDVGEYRREGILPDAMFNYLCLLGWSPKSEQEIYTPDDLIKIFDPAHFNSSNAIFDEEKLVSFNKSHIQKLSISDLAVIVAPLLVDSGVAENDWLESNSDYLQQVISLLKERVRRLSDFVSLGGYFFKFDYLYDEKAAAKHFSPETADYLTRLTEKLDKINDFTPESIEAALGALADELQIKKAKLIHPTRLAVSGMSVGPGLYDLLAALTREVVTERLTRAVEHIKNLHLNLKKM